MPRERSDAGRRYRRLSLLSALLSAPLAWRAERNYRSLPALPSAGKSGRLPAPSSLPPLSIIIPARNEAHNLPPLLASLQGLEYSGALEIIVVDDDSGDGTSAIAADWGARVVRLPGPPAGWSGKAYACHRGAAEAQGDWLLFTDADTHHAPYGPAAAVAYACRSDLDGLSLFLDQRSRGTAIRLALMVAHAGYFVGLGDPAGVLNGQYILLRRESYWDSGGFAAVPCEATEDLALGHHLLRAGYRVPLLRGEHAASVDMYRSVGHMWSGLARFAVTSLRWMGPQSLLSVLYTILVAAPAEILLSALFARSSPGAALLAWVATALGLLPWARRFSNRSPEEEGAVRSASGALKRLLRTAPGPALALLAPLGSFQVQIAAIWGILARLSGRGVRWKARKL